MILIKVVILRQATMGKVPIAIFLGLLLTVSMAARPKQKGIVPGRAGNFSESFKQKVMAYYDMDNNKQIDVLTQIQPTDSNQTELVVYLWNKKRKQYVEGGKTKTRHVQSLLVDSSPQSGYQLIALHSEVQQIGAFISFTAVSCSNYLCTFGEQFESEQLVGVDLIDPSLLKLQGETSLLYSREHEPTVVVIDDNMTDSSSSLAKTVQLDDGSIEAYVFSYFGDYNGDCEADLVLAGPHSQNKNHTLIQFMGGNSGQLSLKYKAIIEEKINHFTIKDINFDGRPDLLLLLEEQIQVHYHKTGEGADLCMIQEHAVYDFDIGVGEEVKQVQRIRLDGSTLPTSRLLFGDYDNDGYPDLTVTYSVDSTAKAFLLRNAHCQDERCSTFNPVFATLSTANTRTFQAVSVPLSSVQRLSFVDMGQDGRLDWIAEQTTFPSIQPVYNNVDYDAFFLTAWILEGQDVVIGGSMAVYVTLLSGQLTPNAASQLTQAGSALQLPYIHLGLGRTNNYLEEVTIKQGGSLHQWSPIIPNSDIILELNSKGEWVLDVLIEPTEKMAFVLLLVIISLLVIGAAILHLTRREKEEDKQNLESFYTLIG